MKNIDLEAMPRSEEKELFKDFMEEYNTATLPHKCVVRGGGGAAGHAARHGHPHAKGGGGVGS